jgi:hypothetical protein
MVAAASFTAHWYFVSGLLEFHPKILALSIISLFSDASYWVVSYQNIINTC